MSVGRLVSLLSIATLILAASPVTAAYSDAQDGDRHFADFREVSRVLRTVTIPAEGGSPGYSGPALVVRYQSTRDVQCGLVYFAGTPYIYSVVGSRYVAGSSEVQVGSDCGSGVTWSPQLLIFLSPPGGYYLRASGPTRTTAPGQTSTGFVREYCNLGNSSHSWLNRISNGGASEDAYLACNAS